MNFKRVCSMLLALALTCSMTVVPILAAPEDDMALLEEQKAEVESEVSDLQTQLNTLMTKMNELEVQLIEKGQEITQASKDLEVAEEKREQQYEDMKLRIKYMYEEGDKSALERFLSSGSIAEALSQAEYIQKVHTYDREMLEEYKNTVKEVEDLKTTLEEEQADLASLQTEYEAQSEEINTTIEEKSAEIENIDAMIQEAARIAEEKRLEEERARKAQEEAERQRQQQQPQQPQNSGGGETGGGDSDEPSGPSYTEPEPDYNAGTGNAIVDRAYSWVGRAEYVWGGCSPGAFDCSGFVSYCLTGAYSRLGTTYTFLGWPQVSNPQPGDVCVNASHCGIYIGGGQMIHAATYGVGVIVGPVQAGMIYVRY